jgi:23S rRNA pseudouridine2605 synthase
MRLAKFLATAGVASRRAAEEIVRAQRVAVNGETVTDPARDVGDDDRVTVDDAPVRAEAERAVYAVNKPAGVVSTARDPQRRPTVVSLVPTSVRLYPVGRLDIDTTGLILLTNDGDLAHRLTHPSFEEPRTYRRHPGPGLRTLPPALATESSWRTAGPPRRACDGWAGTGTSSSSPSMRGETGRSNGCVKRSGIPCVRWSAWPSVR